MSSKKKRKSVERNKNDKVAKTEIIQVKQPFSKGSQNANTNKNTQIVQVIFPTVHLSTCPVWVEGIHCWSLPPYRTRLL